MWQVLVSELVRQNLLECSQRGQLLQAATDRQQQLLHQALSCCDELYRVLLQCSARQLQQQGEMGLAQHEAVALQQECNRLKVGACCWDTDLEVWLLSLVQCWLQKGCSEHY